MSPGGNGSGHAVVFMYPLQGHIVPTFNLAKSLAATGLVVTLVCVEECYARIVKAHGGRDPFADDAKRLALDIRTTLLSDGLPVDINRSINDFEFHLTLLDKMESHVEELMRDLQTTELPVSCIIADTFFLWTSRIAKKFGVPHVSFWTESVMVFSVYYSWDLFIENGHHPFTANESETINYIACAPALKLTCRRSCTKSYMKLFALHGKPT